MGKKLIYVVLGILCFCVRFFFEMQSNIVVGLNGGYYPVQILKIIKHGHLAMNDMPLIFYMNALFVKIALFLWPSFSIDFLVLVIVKVIGALSIPMLLLPLYKINHKLKSIEDADFYHFSIVLFCLFSFSPLYLGTEMMKNAFGLIGFTYLIYFVYQYINFKSTKYALLVGLVLLLIGNTHFGVFSVSLIFLIISLIVVQKKRAILPIIGVLFIGFLIVWLLDPFRAFNAINIFKKWFGVPWRIAFYPAGIVNLIINTCIAILLFIVIKTKNIGKSQKQMFTILLWFVVLLSIPILRFELWRRFSFMLFVPQAVSLIIVYPYLKELYKKKIPVVLRLICGLALIYNIAMPKKSAINIEAFKDLSNISLKIKDPNKTLIISRHGLDWWTVWQLKTKMAQPQIKIDSAIISKYNEILILKQKKGIVNQYPGPNSPFAKPKEPENGILLYSSEYFDLFKMINN